MDPSTIAPDTALGFQPVPETLAELDEALRHAAAVGYWPYLDRLLDRRLLLAQQEAAC